jgi:hypothetical protein
MGLLHKCTETEVNASYAEYTMQQDRRRICLLIYCQ